MALRYIACAPNNNEGEQITRNFLMNMLALSNGILLGNYHLPVNNGTYECDFVLLNGLGIWVIEVKNWRRVILVDRVNWQRDDGFIQHSPLISIETKAKILASILNNEGYKRISVVGLVVLSQANATLKYADEFTREPNEHKVFHLNARFIRALSNRNYLYDDKKNGELSERLMQQIADMRSDLYALGAIWYDMLIRPESGKDINLSQVEKMGLPTDATALLLRLLSPDRDERPRNAKAVKRWLEQV